VRVRPYRSTGGGREKQGVPEAWIGQEVVLYTVSSREFVATLIEIRDFGFAYRFRDSEDIIFAPWSVLRRAPLDALGRRRGQVLQELALIRIRTPMRMASNGLLDPDPGPPSHIRRGAMGSGKGMLCPCVGNRRPYSAGLDIARRPPASTTVAAGDEPPMNSQVPSAPSSFLCPEKNAQKKASETESEWLRWPDHD
jgi:hypothetical protein